MKASAAIATVTSATFLRYGARLGEGRTATHFQMLFGRRPGRTEKMHRWHRQLLPPLLLPRVLLPRVLLPQVQLPQPIGIG